MRKGYIRPYSIKEENSNFMKCLELNVENLISICRKVVFKDSYLCSPVYYLMTCRKGGIIYDNNGYYLISSVHPNADDCILIFNFGDGINELYDFSLCELLAKKILMNDSSIKYVRISRMPEVSIRNYRHLVVEENLLDWKYPVHVLDIEEVVGLKGKGYAQVRQRLNGLLTENCSIRGITSNEDCSIVLNMVESWIRKFPYSQYSVDDLMQPTKTLLSLMHNDRLCIHGQIVYYNNRPSAFCIWEESMTIANAFSMAADRNIHGLAEYNLVETCRVLKSRGIKKINVGGSETEGLNRYKKKFNPVESISLFTCEISRGLL